MESQTESYEKVMRKKVTNRGGKYNGIVSLFLIKNFVRRERVEIIQ